MIADATTIPHVEKKLAYRTRLLEARAVELDDTGEWSADVAEEADRHVLMALNALFDPKDPHRAETARKHMIQAHLHLVVGSRRERVRADR